jgi:hypothetical protein
MYCSEKCRDEDRSTVHHSTCNKIFAPTASPETHITVPQAIATKTMMYRLIACIGLENIKQTALENKHMKSLGGSLRTRGFQGGKFQTANLEALLSLEDNFGKLSKDDLTKFANVCTTFF